MVVAFFLILILMSIVLIKFFLVNLRFLYCYLIIIISVFSILSVVNEQRDESVPRQTVLLSATLTEGVQRLAGLSLKDPIYIDASSIGDTDPECLAIPDSLLQYYVVAPPKLRLVTLSGVLLQKLQVRVQF